MNPTLKTALAAEIDLLATQVSANITFYEHDGFRGRAFTTDRPVDNFGNQGFNDRASSVMVDRCRREVCTDARFDGCRVVLRGGSHESLSGLGMNDQISSVRPVSDRCNYQNVAPAPLAAPTYEYRQRANERVMKHM